MRQQIVIGGVAMLENECSIVIVLSSLEASRIYDLPRLLAPSFIVA